MKFPVWASPGFKFDVPLRISAVVAGYWAWVNESAEFVMKWRMDLSNVRQSPNVCRFSVR